MRRKLIARRTAGAPAELYLYGDIGYDITAGDFVRELDRIGADAAINLRISSAGGEVFDGFTIANRIRQHAGWVTAYVDGLAASMATVIALAADRVLMAEDAFFMIHNPQAVFASGEADELRRQADTMDNVAERMQAVYAERTGLELTTIAAWMAAETWFSAADALEAGFIDEIIEPRAALAAHAGFLRLDRFAHPPQPTGEKPVKTKLSKTLRARLDALAADPTARKSLVAQIARLAAMEVADIDMLLDGGTSIVPTGELLQACSDVLVMPVEQLEADAGEDFTIAGRAPAAAPAGEAPATPATDARMREEGENAEHQRMSGIYSIFQPYPQHAELRDSCIRNRHTVEGASRLLLDAIGQDTQPITGGASTPRIHVIEDQRDKFKAAAVMTLMGRAHPEYRREHGEALLRNEFTGYSLRELARYSVEIAGLLRPGMDLFEIVGLSFTTSDFPNILADVAHKSMMVGFDEAPETWSAWARIGNLSDFKPHKRNALSEFDDLLEITGGSEEYKRGEFTDLGEDIQLTTFGRLFSITRQTIINDDADAFTGIPSGMGRAAARKVGDLAYDVLINGQVSSETGVTTYDAAEHSNLGNAALDSQALDAARAAMATQPGPLNKEKSGAAGAEALNIQPAYLVVPQALKGIAMSIVESQWEWADGAPDSQRPNVARNLAVPVADARMDLASSTQWILTASPNQHPTIEVGFLNGNSAPRLEQENQFTTDGSDFKVSIDAGVRVLDWRGLQKSTGTG